MCCRVFVSGVKVATRIAEEGSSKLLMGVCQGQLGDVLQVVRVGGEAGDAERGGGQLEIDGGLVVLRRTDTGQHTRSIQNTTPHSP